VKTKTFLYFCHSVRF